MRRAALFIVLLLSVRLSLGNNEEVGGAVRGDYVRWNFFADTTLSVGGQVWVKAGKLQAP